MKKQRKTTKKDQKRDQKERYEIARIRRKSGENTRIRAKTKANSPEFGRYRAKIDASSGTVYIGWYLTAQQQYSYASLN